MSCDPANPEPLQILLLHWSKKLNLFFIGFFVYFTFFSWKKCEQFILTASMSHDPVTLMHCPVVLPHWTHEMQHLLLDCLMGYLLFFNLLYFNILQIWQRSLHHHLHLVLMTLGFFCHRPVGETLAARSAALPRRQERDSGGAARFDLYSRRLPQKPALNCIRRGTVGCRRSARACCCQLASGLEAGRRRQETSPSEAGCGRRLWTKGLQWSRERLLLYVSIALVPSTSFFSHPSSPFSHFIFQPWDQLRLCSSTLETWKMWETTDITHVSG